MGRIVLDPALLEDERVVSLDDASYREFVLSCMRNLPPAGPIAELFADRHLFVRLREGRWDHRGLSPMVLARDGHRCRYCRSRSHLSVDHLIARSRGGLDEMRNLVTACRSCNSRKGARTPDEAGMTLLPCPAGGGG